MIKGNLSVSLPNFCLETGDFTFPMEGVTVLFGASGSGKSTFLKAMSGLMASVKGSLTVNEQVWLSADQHLPTHHRNIGYVFQDAALFPHLTVRQNLHYGLKRLPKNAVPFDFDALVKEIGIANLLERQIDFLSGGEKQRVAIARALLMNPDVLLMDEPLSALDSQAKSDILALLERIKKHYRTPIIYITHAPDEVERLADTVGFMEGGKLMNVLSIDDALYQTQTPLYQNEAPRSVLSAKVVAHLAEEGLSHLKAGQADVYVPLCAQSIGESVRVVIQAQQVSLMASVPEKTSMLNHLPVEVASIEAFNDYSLLIRLKIEDEPWPLIAQITKRSQQHLKLEKGQKWVAAIKSVSILG